MKNCITTTLLIFLATTIYSQDLTNYKDSINNFSISIPKDWQHQSLSIANMGLKLNVVKPKESDSDSSMASFNVNLVPIPNSTIDDAYTDMIKTISGRNGYRFIADGDTTIGGKKYKWVIEEHFSISTGILMTAFIYLGYHNNQAYMVTFAANSKVFEKYRLLYKQISATFRL